MFIGHFAVGFAAKRFSPSTSLAVLLAAPMLLDILWLPFLLLGWERVQIDPGNTRFTPLALEYYPWSHSLLMAAVWASAFALIYWFCTRYLPGVIAIWIGIVSHWVLDWITHRPDMPLYPGGPRVGLGLWNSVLGTLAIEIAMFAAGVWLYARTTRARDGIGRYAFVGYVVLLLLLYVASLIGDPPASVAEIILPGMIASLVLLVWAWWFDRHRTVFCIPAAP